MIIEVYDVIIFMHYMASHSAIQLKQGLNFTLLKKNLKKKEATAVKKFKKYHTASPT